VEARPSGVLTLFGRRITIGETLKEIERDASFTGR